MRRTLPGRWSLATRHHSSSHSHASRRHMRSRTRSRPHHKLERSWRHPWLRRRLSQGCLPWSQRPRCPAPQHDRRFRPWPTYRRCWVCPQSPLRPRLRWHRRCLWRHPWPLRPRLRRHRRCSRCHLWPMRPCSRWRRRRLACRLSPMHPRFRWRRRCWWRLPWLMRLRARWQYHRYQCPDCAPNCPHSLGP